MVLFIMYSMSKGHGDFCFDTKSDSPLETTSELKKKKNEMHSTRFSLTCLMASAPSLSLSSLSFRFLDFFFVACNLWFKTVADMTASRDGCLKK